MFFRNDEDVKDFFAFNWENDFGEERKLKLNNGNNAHFTVRISFIKTC